MDPLKGKAKEANQKRSVGVGGLAGLDWGEEGVRIDWCRDIQLTLLNVYNLNYCIFLLFSFAYVQNASLRSRFFNLLIIKSTLFFQPQVNTILH